jgi:hypothetical protein
VKMDIVIAIFADGSAAWCKTEEAGNNERVSSEDAVQRYETVVDESLIKD